jgi:hypothetical protein
MDGAVQKLMSARFFGVFSGISRANMGHIVANKRLENKHYSRFKIQDLRFKIQVFPKTPVHASE